MKKQEEREKRGREGRSGQGAYVVQMEHRQQVRDEVSQHNEQHYSGLRHSPQNVQAGETSALLLPIRLSSITSCALCHKQFVINTNRRTRIYERT